MLDGLSRALGQGFVSVLKANAVGLDTRLTPDLTEAAIAARLDQLAPGRSIAIRHTVGLTDRITGDDSLASEIDAADLSYFKIKLGGDPEADIDRLLAIAACWSSAASTIAPPSMPMNNISRTPCPICLAGPWPSRALPG